MNVENRKKLRNMFPLLYRNCKNIQCGDELYGVLIELSKEIEKILVEDMKVQSDTHPYTTGVKEVYGKLEMSMENGTDEIWDIIAMYWGRTCKREK